MTWVKKTTSDANVSLELLNALHVMPAGLKN